MARGSYSSLASGVLADARHPGSIEFREREALKWFIPAMAHVVEHGDRDRFAERQRIGIVVAPVNGRVIPTYPDVGSDFVHLAANRYLIGVGTTVRHQRESILAGLHDADSWNGRQRRKIVEPSFHDCGTRSSDCAVALPVGRVLRAAFWECVRHEIGAIAGKTLSESL